MNQNIGDVYKELNKQLIKKEGMIFDKKQKNYTYYDNITNCNVIIYIELYESSLCKY